uniref:Uncharacterized protein n=1 Tax=Coccidioides posadasii RMSCC 3488 TaxID=454284 RepID=A0A0J6I7N6_COCPO|nr:hypothetical protein CPAG_03821 [Coccidioides posadasii RMSCC 3488]
MFRSSCGLLPKPWLCFRPRSPVTRHPPTARPAHRRRNWTIPADEPRGGPTRAQGLSFNLKQEKGSAVAVIRTQTSQKIETGNDGGYAVAPPGQFRKLTRLTFSPIPHVGYPVDGDEPSPCEPKTSTTAPTSP